MGTYVFSGGAGTFGFNMLEWSAADIVAMVASVFSSSHSSTEVTYTSGAEVMQARGTLGGYDANGDPTTGTITSFTYTTGRFGAPSMSIAGSGLSLSVPTFINWVVAGDALALHQFLFNGADTMTGSAGGDTLLGYDGNDQISAGLGNDRVDGGAGNDAMSGGDGDDQVTSNAGIDNLNGGAGIDLVEYGRSSATSAFTLLSSEFVSAGPIAFADGTVIANFERFAIRTGAGADRLTLNTSLVGENSFFGGTGVDRVVADFSTSAVDVSMGDYFVSQTRLVHGAAQLILEGVEEFHITSGSGDDHLRGGAGDDVISGGVGSDSILGGLGADALAGGDGEDGLHGEGGDDVLTAGAGNDVLFGGDGANTLSGGDGDDSIWSEVGASADIVDGGTGIDLAHVDRTGSIASVSISSAELGTATGVNLAGAIMRNVERFSLTLGSGADTLTLTSTLVGENAFNGGAGIDRVVADFSAMDDGYSMSGMRIVSGTGWLDLYDVEELFFTGGSLDDTFEGGSGNSQLLGGVGNDTLTGGNGNDFLSGGTGNDRFYLSGGTDTFDGGAGTDFVSIELQGSTANFSVSAAAMASSVGTTLPGGTVIRNVESFDLRTGSGSDVLNLGGTMIGFNNFDAGAGLDRIIADLSGATGNIRLDGFNLTLGQSSGLSFRGVERFQITGGSGSDDLVGGDSSDTFIGNGGGDYLSGGGGANTLLGGDGDDYIVSFGVREVLDGGAGVDTLQLGRATSANILFATSQLASGFTLPDGTVARNFESFNLHTGAGNDALTLDTLLVGENSFYAGAGFDRFSVDFSAETERVQVSDYEIRTASSHLSFAEFEARVIISGSGDDWISGGAYGDAISTGVGNDFVNAYAGDDQINGGAGGDSLTGGDGVDLVTYAASSSRVRVNLATGVGLDGDAQGDTLSGIEDLVGSAFDDVLTGNASTNVLTGGLGADILSGGGGADVLNGGAGGDSADYSASSLSVRVSLATGLALDGDAQGDSLIALENLVGSAFNDTLTGGADANRLTGGAGNDRLFGMAANDVLIGAAGADALDGGDGIDLADYSASAARVRVSLATARGLEADAQGDTLVSIENLTGSAFNDVLTGNANANVLGGGAGADALDGGAGLDLADYAGASAGVQVNLAAGTGQGAEAQGDVLTNIENLTGSAFNDVLTGDGLANVMRGGAGADVLDGAAGLDTAEYSGSAARVRVTLSTGVGLDADAQGDSLVGIESLIGSAFNDLLTGNGGDNTLVGGAGHDKLTGLAGADLLIGGSGADVLDGGDGADTADYAGSTARVRVNLGTGAGLDADAQGDTLIGVENLTGSAFNDILTGNAAANTLAGGAGADALDGAGGVDLADYSASAAGVRADLAAGTGIDGDAQGDTLANIENLTGSGFDDILTGTATANALLGGNGADILRGGAGADILNGGSGVDTADYSNSTARVRVSLATGSALDADAQGDVVTSVENLIGSAFNDQLNGDGGANVLSGGAGHDQLSGLGGADALTGGAGFDVFIFAAALGAGNIDAVTDFSVPNDTIWLDDAVFTGLAAGTLAADAFVTGASAADGNDRIIYNAATGVLLFDADGNGAGAAVQFAALAGGLALTSADFLVI